MPTLDEVSASISESIRAQKKVDQINLIGDSTGSSELAVRNEAAKEDIFDLGARAFRSVNAAVGIASWAERKMVNNDPNFKLAEHWEDIKSGIPVEYWDKFSSVGSLEEALMLKSDFQQEQQDLNILGHAGAKGIVAMGLAGIIDVDAPLMFLSGGTYLGGKAAGVTAKVGIQGTRTAKAIETGVAGLEAGVVTETANVLSRPTGEWTDIPYAGLGGLVFGTGLGAMSKADKAANKSLSSTRFDFDDSIQGEQAGYRDYNSPVSEPTDQVFSFQADSVGAASLKPLSFDADSVNSNVSIKRGEAQQYLIDNGITNQVEFAFPNTPLGKAAGKFHRFLQNTPVASDWDRLFKSNSSIAKALGHKLLESPAGIVRNNRSGAVLNEVYSARIAEPVNTSYVRLFDEYVKTSGLNPDKPAFMSRFDVEMRRKFNQEVMTELQFRYHDGSSNPTSSPAVISMANKIDEASSKAVHIMQGMSSEMSVRGSENLKPEPGWFRQIWRGDSIAKARTKYGKKVIEKGLADAYRKLYPNWEPEQATKFARAVLRRASAKERGIDTNLMRMLDAEGRDFMEEFLVDNGFALAEATRLIDGLKGVNADKSKISTLKSRKDIDLREKIAGTDLRIMDLIDTDIPGVWTTYSRQVAGASAMARHGIQKSDFKDIDNLIKQEEAASGGRTLPDDFVPNIFSYFSGGAFAGGLNPWVRRTLQTTNLSLLNSLGLTQLAESGVTVAAVGWESFVKTAPKEIHDMLSGKTSEALKELKGWTASIEGEHLIHRDYLALDEMRQDPGHFSELGQFIDKLMVRGSQIQGYTSGFYKVKQLQQRIAVRSLLHRLGEMYRNNKAMSDERLYDMGFTSKTAKNIGEYYKNGTVEFAEGGDIHKLNLDKWNPVDVEEFASILNRYTYQVVQKAMRGETSTWMHKDAGAMLAHLKSFTILAMQKQLLRNARIMDPEAAMAFLYSMGTAGVVYTTGQVIKGNGPELDPVKVMKGAFVLSNMTGFIPQWTDPLASMLGMDNLRFNHYGAQGTGGDVIGAPPALSTINRLAHIPSSAAKVVTGNYKNEDIYALQATPIIGNLYGFSYMFNEMKK